MLNALEELCARMAVIENLQRTIIANNLARCPEGESEIFKTKLLAAMKNPIPCSTPLNPREEQKEAEIRDRSVEFAKHFLADCSQLEAAIRKRMEPPGRH